MDIPQGTYICDYVGASKDVNFERGENLGMEIPDDICALRQQVWVQACFSVDAQFVQYCKVRQSLV